jgi:hypothetical protein
VAGEPTRLRPWRHRCRQLPSRGHL